MSPRPWYGAVALGILIGWAVPAGAAEQQQESPQLIQGLPELAAMPAADSSLQADQRPAPNSLVSRWGRRGWLGDLRKDTWHLMTTPARVGRDDLGPALLLAGVVTGSFMLDRTLERFVQRHDELEKFGSYFEPFGDRILPSAIMGATYLSGAALQNDRLKETGFMMAESFVITGATVTALKRLSGRSRPLFDRGPWDFAGPHLERNGEHQSFVSGHTAVAFTLAGVISGEYQEHPLVGAGAYTVASLVGLHRVASQHHWFSDVVVAGLVGNWVGRTVVRLHQKRSEQTAVSFWYEPSSEAVGLRYTRRF